MDSVVSIDIKKATDAENKLAALKRVCEYKNN